MRFGKFTLLLVFLVACGQVAWDTRVAETQASRLAMMESIRFGETTEMQQVARWGQPMQRIREGGRVDFVYRARAGDHSRYVIVTFEHGLAIAVKSNDTENCRASFAQRPAGYVTSTADIVKPVGWCQDPNNPYQHLGLVPQWSRATIGLARPQSSGSVPGVPEDSYAPAPGGLK